MVPTSSIFLLFIQKVKYVTVLHDIRKELNLSLTEYCILNTIHQLSNDRRFEYWCIKKIKIIAEDIGVSHKTAFRAINVLLEKNLIERGGYRHESKYRSTEKYVKIMNGEQEPEQEGQKESDPPPEPPRTPPEPEKPEPKPEGKGERREKPTKKEFAEMKKPVIEKLERIGEKLPIQGIAHNYSEFLRRIKEAKYDPEKPGSGSLAGNYRKLQSFFENFPGTENAILALRPFLRFLYTNSRDMNTS